MNVHPPRPPLLDVNDVAEWLNLPWRTVQHLAQTQQIRAAKLGRQWRFRSQDVEVFVAKQFGEPQPAATPRQQRVSQVGSKMPRRAVGDYVPVFDLPPLSEEQR